MNRPGCTFLCFVLIMNMVCENPTEERGPVPVNSSDITVSSGFVREAKLVDAAAIAEIYRPYVEDTAVSFEYEAPDAVVFAERMRQTMEQYPFLIYETDDGQIVGYACASRFHPRKAYDWSAEVTVYVRWNSRGRGAGKALYGELERLLKQQGVRNLYACIASPREGSTRLSDASIRFHGAMGFRLVGTFCRCGNKFSQWYDMCWMEKIIGNHEADPGPFIPYPKVKEREQDDDIT